MEEYIHSLTHEIKSPLSAIRGAAELLDENMPPEKRNRFLSNIRNEANRIQDIVDRMLEISELETRKTPRHVESFSLNDLVKAALESTEWMLSRKKLKADVDAPENVTMTGDRFLLQYALSNILQNAIDFSLAGERIDTTLRKEGSKAALTVDDHGSGIPEYAAGKVFEKFFSLHRPDTGKKSTGLGLSFVKEAVSLHQGEVRLENRPDKGLRATIILPLGS